MIEFQTNAEKRRNNPHAQPSDYSDDDEAMYTVDEESGDETPKSSAAIVPGVSYAEAAKQKDLLQEIEQRNKQERQEISELKKQLEEQRKQTDELVKMLLESKIKDNTPKTKELEKPKEYYTSVEAQKRAQEKTENQKKGHEKTMSPPVVHLNDHGAIDPDHAELLRNVDAYMQESEPNKKGSTASSQKDEEATSNEKRGSTHRKSKK